MIFKKAMCLGLLGAMATVNAAQHVPGEMIVKLKVGESSSALFSMKALGVELKETISLVNNQQIHVVKFNESNKGAMKAMREMLSDMPEVEYAEPNFIYNIVKPIVHSDSALNDILNISNDITPYYTPIDAKFDRLWGLVNTGSNAPSGVRGVAGADVDALRAWDITQGSRDIKIAVIDTGIDYGHPDLVDQMWVNEAELNGLDGVDDDGNGYIDDIHGYDFANDDGDPRDGHSHGTHVAGTIGASHNAIGVAGVMRDVQFVAIKFLTDSGSGNSANAIKSIDYATRVGVDLMSNSWGGGAYSEALKEAIERASEAGIVFTAAAGNSATNNDSKPHYPSNYQVDNVISVAATTAADELASFSCYGRKTVHIAAPGHKILSTIKDGGYAEYSGTSMATPQVSGVIGLLLSMDNSLTPLEIRNRVMSTSDPIAALRGKTINSGRINAYNLLTNTIPDRNEPNPTDWETVSVRAFESAHPYADNATVVREITVKGAKFIRLKIERYELENKYDYLEVKDASGAVVEKVSGTGTDYEGFYAEGDTLFITFKSDRSVSKWGFAISEVDVQY